MDFIVLDHRYATFYLEEILRNFIHYFIFLFKVIMIYNNIY